MSLPLTKFNLLIKSEVRLTKIVCCWGVRMSKKYTFSFFDNFLNSNRILTLIRSKARKNFVFSFWTFWKKKLSQFVDLSNQNPQKMIFLGRFSFPPPRFSKIYFFKRFQQSNFFCFNDIKKSFSLLHLICTH